jgi:hypothetical protein
VSLELRGWATRLTLFASVARRGLRWRIEPEPGHLAARKPPIEARALILRQEVQSARSYFKKGVPQEGGSDALPTARRGNPDDPVDLAVTHHLDRPDDLVGVQCDECRDNWCGERASDRPWIVPEVPALGCRGSPRNERAPPEKARSRPSL